MKFFISAFSFLAFLTWISHCAIPCGQGRLPNHMNFCIYPQYIQGCVRYETEIKCLECEQGTSIPKKGYKLGDHRCNALEFVKRQ